MAAQPVSTTSGTDSVTAGSAPGEASQAELRERLDAFFPEFRQLYGGLLVKHIGPERLPEVLAALDDEAVQLYFRALQAMEPELVGGLQSLSKRMAVVALVEPPAF